MSVPSREQDAFTFFCKAYGHHMAGEWAAAIANYRKSLEIHPTPEAHTFLGWAFGLMGRFEDAIEECRKAAVLDPAPGDAYGDIGAYLIENGCLDEALVFLEKALKSRRHDDACYPHYSIGRVWEAKGNRVRAMKAYRRALKENPDYDEALFALRKLGCILN